MLVFYLSQEQETRHMPHLTIADPAARYPGLQNKSCPARVKYGNSDRLIFLPEETREAVLTCNYQKRS